MFIYQLLFLEIFKIIPIDIIVINNELPPYDKKGNVTPVTGISPTTTLKFKIDWKAIENAIEKDKYFENRSLDLIDIIIILLII